MIKHIKGDYDRSSDSFYETIWVIAKCYTGDKAIIPSHFCMIESEQEYDSF